jgi:hypothetical protein
MMVGWSNCDSGGGGFGFFYRWVSTKGVCLDKEAESSVCYRAKRAAAGAAAAARFAL